jgi:hypothetical protein
MDVGGWLKRKEETMRPRYFTGLWIRTRSIPRRIHGQIMASISEAQIDVYYMSGGEKSLSNFRALLHVIATIPARLRIYIPCMLRGHRMTENGSQMGPESGTEHFWCRCGRRSFRHTYY